MKIEINKKTKRFIALEFIWLLVLFIVSLSILQIGNYLDKNNEIEDLKAKERKEELKSLKFGSKILWHVLCKNDLYFQDYAKFKKQYEKTEDQIVLYNLCVNNSLYTNSLSEFRVKYFRRESALEACYSLYTHDSRVRDEYINIQDKNDWQYIRQEINNFEIQLKNDSIFKLVYSLFVNNGYAGSEKNFRQLLSEENDISANVSEYDLLNDNLSAEHNTYNTVAEKIVWLLIILLYPLRIWILVVRWCLIQIRQ